MRSFRIIIVLFLLCCLLYNLNALGILRRNHEAIFQNHSSEGVPYDETDNGESLKSLILGGPARESESVSKTKAKDVLVIMKTGATEHWDKIPVHLLTTFTRIPDALFFSDMEEYIGDAHLYDALDECNQSLKNTHPDFELYRNQYRLKNLGQSIPNSHLSGGWNLDKYKFPHLLNKTWSKRPTAEWYVFIEADTYLSWTGLLRMLDQLNPSLPMYIGLPLYASGVRFAHGGAGYILSHATMSRTVGRDVGFAGKYEAEASRIHYGDAILGKALLDYAIEVVDARPMLQREPPQMVAFDESNWCLPVVSLHHMAPSDINAVWTLEKSKVVKRDYLRWVDLFDEFVAPYLLDARESWDNFSVDIQFPKKGTVAWQNLSDIEANSHTSFEACQLACRNRPDCLTFSLRRGTCGLGTKIRLGKDMSHNGRSWDYKSGWQIKRIQDLRARAGSCE